MHGGIWFDIRKVIHTKHIFKKLILGSKMVMDKNIEKENDNNKNQKHTK